MTNSKRIVILKKEEEEESEEEEEEEEEEEREKINLTNEDEAIWSASVESCDHLRIDSIDVVATA